MEVQDVKRTEQTDTHQVVTRRSKQKSHKLRQFMVTIKHTTPEQVRTYRKTISACNMQHAKHIVEHELIVAYPRQEVSYKVTAKKH